ncbi:hypothetical protein [Rhodococcus ruber]|uniref:hypothetical protein n=1 Tax=Rhodococcus ruber TaxID=1830 RepID=UPI000C7C0472|nr:hypothetical protein [Rhodococcus ruber]AUM20261.1 hypothetical protein CSW53_27230 [Rhodococcus ruber]
MTVTDLHSPTTVPELVNLTPHPITLLGVHRDVRLSPSGTVARLDYRTIVVTGYLRGVPVLTEEHPVVTGLPAHRAGTYLIVSRAVMAACPHRHDLLSPGQLVRDEDGAVCAARTLVTTPPIPEPPREADR